MKLLDKTESMQRKFASLVFDVRKDLEKNHKKLEDVISLAQLHYGKSDEIDRLFDGCTSFTEVFGRLSKYYSFFNYGIIKLLVHKLNSTAIAQKLEKYKKAFREYSKLRICECPSGVFGSCEDKEKVYVLKTEKKLNDSLEEYEKLQFQMNKVLGGKLLRLINVEEGCVQLTFRGFVEPELSLSKENGQELRNIGVLCLTYGDQVFDFSSSAPQKPAKPGMHVCVCVHACVYACYVHICVYICDVYILYQCQHVFNHAGKISGDSGYDTVSTITGVTSAQTDTTAGVTI